MEHVIDETVYSVKCCKHFTNRVLQTIFTYKQLIYSVTDARGKPSLRAALNFALSFFMNVTVGGKL